MSSVDEDMARMKELTTEAEWKDAAVAAVAAHGRPAVEGWKDTSTKHKHRLVHLLVAKNYPNALRAVVGDLGFDVNVQRDSDQCTPMHLAMFFKKPEVVKALQQLGADLELKNSYGEACNAKYAAFAESYQNIIWLDLELTSGHYDAGEPEILEVAAIVTDKNLGELASGQWAVGGFSEERLAALPEFHQKHFRDAEPGGRFPPLPDCPGNGLFTAIVASQTTAEQVETELLKMISAHCPERGCPLAGNSVQCDREVLKLRMPRVYAFLNHRIIDVSSFGGVIDRWLPGLKPAWEADQKENAVYDHRAMNDIRASIQSMRWIKAHMLVQPAAHKDPGAGDGA